jgi:hypothetical protein
LLCIHSKKHIKNPPEKVAEKQAQNLESMKALGSLTSQGGSVFWVAPRWVCDQQMRWLSLTALESLIGW